MQFLVLVIVQIFRQDFFHYVFVLIDRHDRCIEVKTKSAYYRKNGKIVEKFGDSKYCYQIQNCNHYLLHATKGKFFLFQLLNIPLGTNEWHWKMIEYSCRPSVNITSAYVNTKRNFLLIVILPEYSYILCV